MQQPGIGVVLLKPIKGAEVAAPNENKKLTPGKTDIPKGALIVVPAANFVPEAPKGN